jgi:hypothetical protein
VTRAPGDYHLDVMMIPVGNGSFIVNDAEAAVARQRAWARQDHAKREPKAPRRPSAQANERHRAEERPLWRDEGAHIDERLDAADKHARLAARGLDQRKRSPLWRRRPPLPTTCSAQCHTSSTSSPKRPGRMMTDNASCRRSTSIAPSSSRQPRG